MEQYEYVLDCGPEASEVHHILNADVQAVMSLAERLDEESPEAAAAARALADLMKPLIVGSRVIEYTELAVRSRRVLVRGGNEADAYATLSNRYTEAPVKAWSNYSTVDVDVDAATEVVEVLSWQTM